MIPKSKDTDKVSIILSAYNEGLFIGDALTSLLAQRYENIEIVAVCDGSTDCTYDVIHRYAIMDDRIKPIRLRQNKGKVVAKNIAFRYATGSYLAIASGDDIFGEEWISQGRKLLGEKNLSSIFFNLRIFNEKNDPQRTRLFFNRPPKIRCTLASVIAGESMPCAGFICTRDLAEKVFSIPEALMYEDRWISNIAYLEGSFEYVHDAHVFYRINSGNTWLLRDNIKLDDFLKARQYLRHRDVSVLIELKKRYGGRKDWHGVIDRLWNRSMSQAASSEKSPCLWMLWNVNFFFSIRPIVFVRLTVGYFFYDLICWTHRRIKGQRLDKS